MSGESGRKINMDKVKDLDLYLLLDVSPDAGDKEIKKSYRKKALKCHPDKNPDDPKAAELFHQLSEALAILSDPSARKAYDNVLKAKKANEIRNRQLDEKRKKLKDSLEAREAAARKEQEDSYFKRQTSEETLRKELERLQKEGQKQLEEEQERIRLLVREEERQRQAGHSTATTSTVNVGPAKLKVKWKKVGGGGSCYNDTELRKIFSKYGDVENVVVMEEKRVGLVEMKLKTAAVSASKIETGYSDNPLKIKLLEDPSVPDETGGPSTGSATTANSASSSHNSSRVGTGIVFEAQSFDDYETLVMRKMRQAEERKRLEAEILAQDDAEEKKGSK